MPAALEPGTFLIASLGLEEETFTRTVVLLLQHVPDEYTLGVIINRPLGERANLYSSDELQNLTKGLRESGGTLSGMFFQGGPVDPGSLIFLHRVDQLGEKSTRICDGLYAGGDLDALREHTSASDSDKAQLRFYLGYADWSPGQLEAEIALGAWVLCPGDAELVFSEEPGQVWHEALHSLGGKYAPMSFIPEDPSLN